MCKLFEHPTVSHISDFPRLDIFNPRCVSLLVHARMHKYWESLATRSWGTPTNENTNQ